MKRLKKNQKGPWCSFCPPKTSRAVWRDYGFMGVFACEDCSEHLESYEYSSELREARITNADEQTWMRL